MEIYPKKGESFSYTTQAIQVVGTLEVSESEDKPFTDMYGYEFCCKIVDATYTIIKAEDLSEDMALWQKIANTDVVNDIYKMYDYVNFLCVCLHKQDQHLPDLEHSCLSLLLKLQSYLV